jgi:hypothetical protein
VTIKVEVAHLQVQGKYVGHVHSHFLMEQVVVGVAMHIMELVMINDK